VAGMAGATTGGGSNVGGDTGVGGSTVQERIFDVYVACSDSSGTIGYYTANSATGAVTDVNAVTTDSPITSCSATSDLGTVYVTSDDSAPSTITGLSRTMTGVNSGRLTLIGTTEVPPAAQNAMTRSATVDETGGFVLAASTGTDSVDVFPIAADGSLGDVADSVSSVSSLDPFEAVVIPGSENSAEETRLIAVAYHASDKVEIYVLASDGSLSAPVLEAGASSSVVLDNDSTDSTTGPRQVVFHPTAVGLAYVVNEVAGTITRVGINTRTGAVTARESVSAVPTGYAGASKLTTQAIVSPDGLFLYVLNRYANSGTSTEGSVVVFSIDQTSGALTQVSSVSTEGAVPKNMSLSADGGTLLVVNQNSDSVAVFSVDATTGALSYLQSQTVCSSPTCVQMIEE
jgi:6-phosphogluconolactonase